jgi:hypothetical protein
VPELEVRERSPSTLRNVTGRPPEGARVGGLGAPTINAKKYHRRAPGGAEAEGSGALTINVKTLTAPTPGGAESEGPVASTINVKTSTTDPREVPELKVRERPSST